MNTAPPERQLQCTNQHGPIPLEDFNLLHHCCANLECCLLNDNPTNAHLQICTITYYSSATYHLAYSQPIGHQFIIVSDTSDKDATNIQEVPKTTSSRSTAMEVLLVETIQENQTDSDSVETGDNEDETDSLSQTQDTATAGIREDETTSLEQTQGTTSNTWSASMDETIEIRRTSTRNKKIPSTEAMIFYGKQGL